MEEPWLENLIELLLAWRNRAYALAKGFEGQYNKGTTSPVMQKYWLDMVDDYIFNQRALKDLPTELQGLSKQVKELLEEVSEKI